MKKYLSISLIMFLLVPTYAQEPATEAPPVDPELKDLSWNRYATKSFTILSIDNEKGKWLSENVEEIKASALTRWGFPDVKFSKECRLFAVPNFSLLQKLFNSTAPRVQFRKELNAAWLVVDDKPNKTVLPYVTQVALAEYENAHNTTLPWWFKRGVINLNSSVVDVRQSLKNFYDLARKEQFSFTTEQMLQFTEDDYNKQNMDNKKIFDQQSMCLCLLLRKEFGEAKLQGFLRMQSKNKPEDVLNVVYGFKSYSQFEKSYIQFMKDLTSDVDDNDCPDAYLEIIAAR